MARNAELPTQSITDRHLQPHLLNRSGSSAFAQLVSTVLPSTPSEPGTLVFDYAASAESVVIEPGTYAGARLSAPIALVATGAVTMAPWAYTAPSAVSLDVAASLTVDDMDDVAGLLLALRVLRSGGRWMDVAASSWATLSVRRRIALYTRVDLGPGDVVGTEMRCLTVRTSPITYDLRISAMVST